MTTHLCPLQLFVDGFIASYDTPPEAVVLDIDDTDDEVHGKQKLSLFNGYYDERCYMPLHIYEGQTGRLNMTVLHPRVRPAGKQIVSILKRLVKTLRQAWPDVGIFSRGGSHFSCPDVHDFCDKHEVYFALGQAGNTRLAARGHPLMAQAKVRYQETGQPVQLFTCFGYQAHTWVLPRRIIHKTEITASGHANARFVVTNLESSQPSFIALGIGFHVDLRAHSLARGSVPRNPPLLPSPWHCHWKRTQPTRAPGCNR